MSKSDIRPLRPMQKLINRLFAASTIIFLITAVFFAGRTISHSKSGGYLSPHQMWRSLIISGGLSIILLLTQLFISVKKMNDQHKESMRWS